MTPNTQVQPIICDCDWSGTTDCDCGLRPLLIEAREALRAVMVHCPDVECTCEQDEWHLSNCNTVGNEHSCDEDCHTIRDTLAKLDALDD